MASELIGVVAGHFTAREAGVRGFLAIVVENLDVIEQVATCFLATAVDATSYPLLLRAAEGRLCHGVIPAIATPAHADLQTMLATESTPIVTTVLHALVRVDHYA